MSNRTRMAPARRSRIPGMTPTPVARGEQQDEGEVVALERPVVEATQPPARVIDAAAPELKRWPSADYSATRLVNMRLPVDLHERFKAAVREAEAEHGRLSKPSLTEFVIAILEETPASGDQVAGAIRRKRSDQNDAAT